MLRRNTVRDPQSPAYATYSIVDAKTREPTKDTPADAFLSLAQVEDWLRLTISTELERSRDIRAGLLIGVASRIRQLGAERTVLGSEAYLPPARLCAEAAAATEADLMQALLAVDYHASLLAGLPDEGARQALDRIRNHLAGALL